VYTHPDHARLGVATALYTALIDRLAGLGFHAAVAAVTLPNPASVALHERLGFTHAGTFREVGRKFDAWHDVAFFQRPITRTP
jgi:phosphinothricin acetyltransferase